MITILGQFIFKSFLIIIVVFTKVNTFKKYFRQITANECMLKVTGHARALCDLKQITSNILASADVNAAIKLWNITSGRWTLSLT